MISSVIIHHAEKIRFAVIDLLLHDFQIELGNIFQHLFESIRFFIHRNDRVLESHKRNRRQPVIGPSDRKQVVCPIPSSFLCFVISFPVTVGNIRFDNIFVPFGNFRTDDLVWVWRCAITKFRTSQILYAERCDDFAARGKYRRQKFFADHVAEIVIR